MSWRARLEALANDLREHPRVEVRAFHLFPPATAGLERLPAALAALYRETDGVQLAWADRQAPGYDPAAERWEDAPAPWSAADGQPGWTGAIWIPPLRENGRYLDLAGDRIELEGFVAVLADGRRLPPEEALEHLIRWWGSLAHRGEQLAHGAGRMAFSEVLGEELGVVRGVGLGVTVIEVRRSAAADAVWSWVDRGLDPDQVSRAWTGPAGTGPPEVVELELEVVDLPPSLRPAACSAALVGQLLGPWGRPKRFTAAVDLTERPHWTVAFPAAVDAATPTDERTAEITEDTEIRPAADPAVVVLPPQPGDAESHGFQYAVSIHHPGVTWHPRVLPSPVDLESLWSDRVFEGGSVHALAASADGGRLAAIAVSGALRMWSATDGRPITLAPQRELESYSDVGFGPEGRLAVWDGNLVVSWGSDGAAAGFVHLPMLGVEGFEADGETEYALWATRPVLVDLRRDQHGTIDSVDEDPVARAAVSANGLEMALGTEGGQVAMMDLAPLGRRWVVATDLGEIRSLAVAPGLVAVGGREAVALLDANGRELRRLRAHDGEIVGIAWAAGGRYLATVGLDRWLKLWCARSGALLLERALPQPPAALAVPPDGQWVAVALPNRVAVFAVRSGS